LNSKLEAVCKRLVGDSTIRRNVLVVATGKASLGLEKAVATLIKAKAYHFMGRYLDEWEFTEVASEVEKRVRSAEFSCG